MADENRNESLEQESNSGERIIQELLSAKKTYGVDLEKLYARAREIAVRIKRIDQAIAALSEESLQAGVMPEKKVRQKRVPFSVAMLLALQKLQEHGESFRLGEIRNEVARLYPKYGKRRQVLYGSHLRHHRKRGLVEVLKQDGQKFWYGLTEAGKKLLSDSKSFRQPYSLLKKKSAKKIQPKR